MVPVFWTLGYNHMTPLLGTAMVTEKRLQEETAEPGHI